MTLDPLLQAPLVIQVHAASALAALVIGGAVLWLSKGTRTHRLMGRIWVGLMIVAAGSSLGISEGMRLLGPFGPIHLFVLLTANGLARGMWAIRVRRDVAAHARAMRETVLYALALAGAFTLLPGRRLHLALFGPDAGYAPALVAVAAALGAILLSRLRPPSPRPRTPADAPRAGAPRPPATG
jgi:uncharacterized membrane protein